jgi:hypothetical protein
MTTDSDNNQPHCSQQATLDDLIGIHVDDRELYMPPRVMLLGQVSGEGRKHCVIGTVPWWRRLLKRLRLRR